MAEQLRLTLEPEPPLRARITRWAEENQVELELG